MILFRFVCECYHLGDYDLKVMRQEYYILQQKRVRFCTQNQDGFRVLLVKHLQLFMGCFHSFLSSSLNLALVFTCFSLQKGLIAPLMFACYDVHMNFEMFVFAVVFQAEDLNHFLGKTGYI